jgi:putative sporulation protein YyaC
VLGKKIVQQYININNDGALSKFCKTLNYLICKNLNNEYRSIVFVCIGTDRSTGDSLGPLVGYKIGKLKSKRIFAVGNLESPVHAKNIDNTINEITEKYNEPLIVVIDACLGRMEHIGFISIGEGPIKPGSGVNKNLLPVGDIHITGIVNFGGFMDFMILQNTRLNTVMKMADIVASGIRYVVEQFEASEKEDIMQNY